MAKDFWFLPYLITLVFAPLNLLFIFVIFLMSIRPLDTLVVNRRRSHIVHLLTWNHYFCLPLYLTFTSVFIHMNVYQCLYQLLRRIHKRWIGHIQLHFCRDRNFSSSLHHNLPKQRHCRLQFVWFTYLRIVRKKDYTF